MASASFARMQALEEGGCWKQWLSEEERGQLEPHIKDKEAWESFINRSYQVS